MNTMHISTYCEASSYGSILQAMGLKKVLNELGYRSVIDRLGMQPTEKVCITFHGKSIKGTVAALLRVLQYPKLQKKHRNNCEFIRENLDVCYYPDLDSMRKALQGEKLFLAGSDQIWNPVKMAEDFFLKHAPAEAKKVSYAASMGITDIPTIGKEKFEKLLATFDEISVREKDIVPIISEYTDKRVDVHIDPSFFLDATEWRAFQKPYPISGPYILVYPLYWSPRLNEQLRKLHRITGKKIVVLADNRRNIYANEWIYDADIGQFLWLIDHADAVISSSFHGVALSLNYNKMLMPVINPSAPSRITNILDLLNYPNITVEELENPTRINYEQINQKILREKQRGMDYLKEVLQA